MEKRFYIYGLSAKEKIGYIGASINPERRFKEHLYEMRNPDKYPSSNLEKLKWIKSNTENGNVIDLVILEEVSTDDGWEAREIFYIKKYRELNHPITNMSDGGFAGVGALRKGVPNPTTAKRNVELCSQPILQYSKQGEFISEYPSASECSRQTGIENLSQACQWGKWKAVGGFIWFWKSEFTDELLKFRIEDYNNLDHGGNKRKSGNNPAARRIKQIHPITNETVAEFDCIRDAIKSVGNGKGDIGACCRGKQKTACGYKWRYKTAI